MRNPRPAINTFPTPSQELTMFALLAPSILFLCIAIWHKEANYTEECVGSINLHDVTKCNKNEGISKKKNLNYYSERSVLSPVNGACLHLVFWKEILPQAVKNFLWRYTTLWPCIRGWAECRYTRYKGTWDWWDTRVHIVGHEQDENPPYLVFPTPQKTSILCSKSWLMSLQSGLTSFIFLLYAITPAATCSCRSTEATTQLVCVHLFKKCNQTLELFWLCGNEKSLWLIRENGFMFSRPATEALKTQIQTFDSTWHLRLIKLKLFESNAGNLHF